VSLRAKAVLAMGWQTNSRWALRLLLVLSILGGAGCLFRAVNASSGSDAADAARKAYSEKTLATYNSRFGADHPFLPSNATTDTGQFIDSKSFPNAKYCGHCHEEAHTEWRQSAHSNSNRPPWYLRNTNLLKAEKGVEYTRHCEGCHDPIALLSGALTQNGPGRKWYDDEGITCSVCHSIQRVDTRGTGSYVLGVPAVLVDEDGKPVTRPVSDAEILAHLDRHSKAVMKDFYHTSQFCSACHEAALPKTLNDYKWQRAISLYEEWQASSFAKQSPLPFYVKDSVSTCQTCHMPRETVETRDEGAKQGKLASHRWLGANTLIPQFYGYDVQERRTVEFLQNNVFNVDLFALERGIEANGDPEKIVAPLGLVNFRVDPGEQVTLDVVIQNKGIAHSHVPEQRDMYESWVDFTVKDSAGRLLCESGFLKSSGDLDPEAHSFTNRLINGNGGLNDLHQVWNNRVVAYNNTIQSGRSQVVRYSFTMPSEVSSAVNVTTTVKYRRFDQHFIDFGMAKQHYVEPVVDMVSVSRTIRVGENAPTPPGPDENKEWMRWNNYGIALLDAQQYAASHAAFQRVAKLRPDYADAYTNVAIVDIQWERYADARSNLAKALQLSPNNARALYYRALVERNEGMLDLAIADFEEMVRQYPLSRDAHRELGFTLYQEHRYADALKEYEALQEIAPDDLAAHYNLAILYRRMGERDKANREAGMFADQKDDPVATTYALEFLRKHPNLANESVPWHVHDLQMLPMNSANASADSREAHTR
jgi:tetratricopeptide (TPR) repeat protein